MDVPQISSNFPIQKVNRIYTSNRVPFTDEQKPVIAKTCLKAVGAMYGGAIAADCFASMTLYEFLYEFLPSTVPYDLPSLTTAGFVGNRVASVADSFIDP